MSRINRKLNWRLTTHQKVWFWVVIANLNRESAQLYLAPIPVEADQRRMLTLSQFFLAASLGHGFLRYTVQWFDYKIITYSEVAKWSFDILSGARRFSQSIETSRDKWNPQSPRMGCHNLLFMPELCVSIEFTQGTLNSSSTIILCSLRRF